MQSNIATTCLGKQPKYSKQCNCNFKAEKNYSSISLDCKALSEKSNNRFRELSFLHKLGANQLAREITTL